MPISGLSRLLNPVFAAASLLCALFLAPPAHALEKATIQLKWLHHFQFAGYYAALEKGFYRQAGLDVEIREGGPSTEVEKEVTSGRADFGVGTSALLLNRAHGDDLVVLAQIFQHSSAIFLTPRKTGIRSIADMAGRRFMYSNQHGDMLTLLKKNGIGENDILKVAHRGDPRDLISGKAEVMIAYSFNEAFILEQSGEPYLTFSPLTYGIDFYGDNFFATRELTEARPQFTKAFREATLRGWRYALENKSEVAELIYSRYSREKSHEWLMFEANQIEALIQPALVELGYQSPTRWMQISETFKELGMLPRDFQPAGIIYSPEPQQNYRLLAGATALSCTIIAILTVTLLSFRRLNRNLRAEIGERKQAEEAFRESKERLRVIIETSQAGIVMVNPQGIISFANKRMAEMFGSPLEEVVGSSYTSHLHPGENEAGDLLMRRLIKGDIDHVHTERHYLTRDGTDFWGYLSGRRLETAEGELKALVGIIADISDRKKAEDARNKEFFFIENLFAQSPMGISVFDGETGDCLRLNQAAADIAGGSIDILLHQNLARGGWQDAGIGRLAEAVLSDGMARHQEQELQATSGKQITARYFLSRFFVEGRAHLLVMGQDTTKEKRLDKENKRIEARLLNMQKLESLGVLAGGIAHDFNNILTGMIGNISLAQMMIEPSHRSHNPLLKAEKASHRAAELATQLLTFARGGKPIKKAFSVKPLVGESVSFVLDGTNVKGVIDIPDTLAIIEADEGQINQAFNNVIINAVHAMPCGGTLTIAGENAIIGSGNGLGLQPGAYVRLTFIDEGCGIPEAHQKNIFDPYFTTKASGTGLGLASTHSIINKHDGVILVNSTVGKGTSFSIYLPSTGKLSEAGNADAEAPLAAPDGGSVLVMDDEEMIQELTRAMLGELGYRVQTCYNGAEAIDLYREAREAGTPFSAVLMDLTIPGKMGGKEAASRLIELDPKARLVVSSGYSNDPVMAEPARFGFSATLMKPYTAAQLARVMREVITAQKTGSAGASLE